MDAENHHISGTANKKTAVNIFRKIKLLPFIAAHNSRGAQPVSRKQNPENSRQCESTTMIEEKPKSNLASFQNASQLISNMQNSKPYKLKKPNRQYLPPANFSISTPTGTKQFQHSPIDSQNYFTPNNLSSFLSHGYYGDMFEKYKLLNKNIKNKEENTQPLNATIKESHIRIKKRKVKLNNPSSCDNPQNKEFKPDLTNVVRRLSIDLKLRSPQGTKIGLNLNQTNNPQSNHRSSYPYIQGSNKRENTRNLSNDESRKDQESLHSKPKVGKPKTLELLLDPANSNKVFKFDFEKSKSKESPEVAKHHRKSDSDFNHYLSRIIQISEANKPSQKSTFSYKKKDRIFCCF